MTHCPTPPPTPLAMPKRVPGASLDRTTDALAAQLGDLRREIEELHRTARGLHRRSNGIQRRVDGQSAAIAGLRARIATLEGDDELREALLVIVGALAAAPATPSPDAD